MNLIDRARSLGVAALAGALLLVAACGGNSGTTAAAPKTSASADPLAAFRECLRQHGIALPEGRRGGPSGPPGGVPSISASRRQALQACGSLAPNGGRLGGGADQSALKAFQSCMSQHGVKVTNSFRPGALRTATAGPKAAAAFRTCRALLPGRPSGVPSAAPSPSPSS